MVFDFKRPMHWHNSWSSWCIICLKWLLILLSALYQPCLVVGSLLTQKVTFHVSVVSLSNWGSDEQGACLLVMPDPHCKPQTPLAPSVAGGPTRGQTHVPVLGWAWTGCTSDTLATKCLCDPFLQDEAPVSLWAGYTSSQSGFLS